MIMAHYLVEKIIKVSFSSKLKVIVQCVNGKDPNRQ